MENSIAVRTGDDFLTHFEQRKELASTLLKSKFLPASYTSPEQVLTVMLKGNELNIPPMEALAGIHIIQGKPTVSPQLMLGLINRSGLLEDMKIEDDGNTCTVTMKRKGRSPHTVTFSMSDANGMQLSKKDNWTKQPKVMRQWRAISACARIVFPDVIGGMYTTEEIAPDVRVSEEGEIIEAVTIPSNEYHHEPEQPAPSQQVKVTENISVGKEFDPSSECITKGKFSGSMWADVPPDTLEWYTKNMTGDVKVKAEATLRWLSQRNDQPAGSTAHEGNVVDEMFPENPAPKQSKFDSLCASLTAAANKKDAFSLDIWITENKADLASLPENEKDILRKSWTNAKNELTPKAKKASK